MFGSNSIESAGAGWALTSQLCRAVFRGEAVADDISERDPEFAAFQRDLPAQTPSVNVLRCRREIVQHAEAARYLLGEIYLRGRPLTEETIRETHRILTRGIDTLQGVGWEEYSGVYRIDEVHAGLHQFLHAVMVPGAMKRLVSSLHRDLEQARVSQRIDAVAFAAKYCHPFVNIHPFLDGNGRMCRLILNALLLTYGGTLVAIGETSEDREKYVEVAATGSLMEALNQDDDDEPMVPKAYKGLASLTLHYATESMRELLHVLAGAQ